MCCLVPIRYKVGLTLDDTSDTSDNYITRHITKQSTDTRLLASSEPASLSPPAFLHLAHYTHCCYHTTKKKIVLVLIARKDVLSSSIHCPFGNKEIINNCDLNDCLTKIWITEWHIRTDYQAPPAPPSSLYCMTREKRKRNLPTATTETRDDFWQKLLVGDLLSDCRWLWLLRVC